MRAHISLIGFAAGSHRPGMQPSTVMGGVGTVFQNVTNASVVLML